MFDPTCLDLIVEFRYALQCFGGDQPDLARVGIGNAHHVEVDFHIAVGHGADLLVIEGHAFLGNTLRLGEASDLADEGSVHHGFQFGCDLLTVRLAARVAHLEILGSDAKVAGLRGLQKSEHAAGGSGAIQGIGGSGSRGRGRLS